MWARGRLLGAAVLFSTGGAAIKGCGLSSWQVAGFRCGVAAVALVMMLPASRRRWTLRTFWVGLAYASTLVFYALANKTTTAANAIFLQSSAPLYVLVMAHVFLGERSRRSDHLSMMAILAGLGLIFFDTDVPSGSAPEPMLGNMLALFAGLAWALTILGLRWLASSGVHPATAVVAGNVFAFVATAPMAFPVTDMQLVDLSIVLYLGIFQIAFAYVLMTTAVPSVPALETSLLLLLDPVLSPIWAWLLHREVPGTLALLGGSIILSATVARVWYQRRSASTQ